MLVQFRFTCVLSVVVGSSSVHPACRLRLGSRWDVSCCWLTADTEVLVSSTVLKLRVPPVHRALCTLWQGQAVLLCSLPELQ